MACRTCDMIRGILMAQGVPEGVADYTGKLAAPIERKVKKKAKKVVKRKLTEYQRFLKSELPKLKRKFPRTKQPALMKKAALIWRRKKRGKK